MTQLYSLGALVAALIFGSFLLDLTMYTPASDAAARDAVYATMARDSAQVRAALEGAVKRCAATEYNGHAPPYFQRAVTSAYLSTLSLPGVPSGKPPSSEAIKARMQERTLAYWQEYARAAKGNAYNKKDADFFSFIQNFHKSTRRLDDCVYPMARDMLASSGLITAS